MYDYFNYWYAILLNPISIKITEKNRTIKRIEDQLNQSKENLFSDIDFKEVENKKIKYIEHRRHIRYPEIEKNYINPFDRTIYCKIRINPCIASDDKNENYTKIWTIFYNKEASNFSGLKLISILEELDGCSQIIFDCVKDGLASALNKDVSVMKSNYDIKMINSSIHEDYIKNNIQNEDKDYLKQSPVLELPEMARRNEFGRDFWNDIRLLSDENRKSSNKAIKRIDSRYYTNISMINSDKSLTRIAQLAVIEDSENKFNKLYHEPRLKAIDFSRGI